MKKLQSILKNLYLASSGYSYTNLGRLFLRLFVGIMLIQFGVRQLTYFHEIKSIFPSVLGMDSELSLIVLISIEIICSLFIMMGFLTRLMSVVPLVVMIVAEYYILSDFTQQASYMLNWQQQGYLPVMFCGIYFFLLLVGPGKISIDYFLSLHIIHTENRSEDELEEV
ncbi:MAG: DoxX family protein [Muribaculaceae bacterium]|nr:DoxX family protein [Muribaculaceae bacterium]MBQ5697309.1 DoxX family protein [Muribaculaceae bacterium]MBQ5723688.1 DoxX family protein [Muribaculaceae bacterium]